MDRTSPYQWSLSIISILVSALLSMSATSASPVEIRASDDKVSLGPNALVASIPITDAERYFGGARGLLLERERAALETGLSALLQSADAFSWQENTRNMVTLDSQSRLSLIQLDLIYMGSEPHRFIVDMTGVHGLAWRLEDMAGVTTSHLDDFTTPLGGRPIVDVNALVPLNLLPGVSYKLTILTYTVQPEALVRLELRDAEAYRAKRTADYLIDGAYFGLVANLTLASLFLFAFLRQSLYLYFTLFLVASGGVLFVASGLAAVVWPTLRLDQLLPSTYFFVGMVGLFGTLFSRRLLEIPSRDRPLDRIWIGVAFAYGLSTPIIVFLTRDGGIDHSGFQAALSIAAVVGLAAQLVYVYTAVRLWRESLIVKFWVVAITTHTLVLLGWPALLDSPIVQVIEPYNLTKLWVSVDLLLLFGLLAYRYRTEQQAIEEVRRSAVENLRLAHDLQTAKASFVDTVSHDLRAPVQAIEHFVESMRAQSPPGMSYTLDQIHANVDSISELLDALVTLSEIEHQSRTPEMVTVPLAPIVGRMREDFRRRAVIKHLDLTFDVEARDVFTAPVLFSQILRNLLDNAVKYTNQGFIRVVARSAGDLVHMTIEDSGIGIPEGQHARVFDEFVQVHESASAGGVGLGLSIVRRLADLLGIRIELSSVQGCGTSIDLWVPTKSGQIVRHGPDESRVGSPPELKSISASRIVVIIDGNHEEIESMCLLLEQWGCDVRQLSSAQSVTPGTMGDWHPDAAIMDTKNYEEIARTSTADIETTPVLIVDTDKESPEHLISERHVRVSGIPKPIFLRSFLQRQLGE